MYSKMSKQSYPDKKYELNEYNVYLTSGRERFVIILVASGILFTIGYIFYRDAVLSLLFCPFALYYPNIIGNKKKERRKKELNIQFREMLYSLSSSLSAGKTLEMALRGVENDLNIIYPDPNTDIIIETKCILRKININESLESALSDFANRADIEDIHNFVDVLCICKRTGGNIVEIIRNTSNIISDKIEITQEIDTMLAKARFEHKILFSMPVIVMLFLSVSAGDFIKPIFEEIIGKIMMTISITLLLVTYLISKKIMDIKI